MQTPIAIGSLRVLATPTPLLHRGRGSAQSPRTNVGDIDVTVIGTSGLLWTRSPLDELGYRGWCCPQQDLGRQRHTFSVASTATRRTSTLAPLGAIRQVVEPSAVAKG